MRSGPNTKDAATDPANTEIHATNRQAPNQSTGGVRDLRDWMHKADALGELQVVAHADWDKEIGGNHSLIIDDHPIRRFCLTISKTIPRVIGY